MRLWHLWLLDESSKENKLVDLKVFVHNRWRSIPVEQSQRASKPPPRALSRQDAN